jgi:hypothetical protein
VDRQADLHVRRAQLGTAAGVLALAALSAFLRTRNLDVGYWIDEGLSVGIADRPLTEIPGALRLDGSPPLYYVLLHLWLGVAGRGEEATHALSLLFATACVPVAFVYARAIFASPRAGWIAAVLAAFNPFLTHYAQETRMYALVILLGTVACGAFALALLQGRRGQVPVLAVALAALLYTHNWALFFCTAVGVAWLLLLAVTPRGPRRELLRNGMFAFGGALVLYAPWVPTTLFQAAHTGAPWALAPPLNALTGSLAQLTGPEGEIALLLGAGFGVAAWRRAHDRNAAGHARVVLVLAAVAAATVALAWTASQVEPAWAVRYLAIAVPPVVLAAAGGLAGARGLGLAALVVVVWVWIPDDGREDKSNVRDVAAALAPSVSLGDLVVSTQPEQVPVLHHYLPDGLRYATLDGELSELDVTDWRDGVERLGATSARADLAPLVDRLEVGRRLVLVEPTIYDLARWSAPWTRLVRIRSTEWRQYLQGDPRLVAVAVQPVSPLPRRPNAVNATVYVKRSIR